MKSQSHDRAIWRRSSQLAVVALAATLLAACGDNNPGDNVPPITTASPNGGLTRGEITLTANEPAKVYYTIDGSAPTTASASGPSPVTLSISDAATVKFFAVDTNGNEEVAQSLDFGYHRFGPLPLVALHAAADDDIDGQVNLAWETPAGAAEVVIVRGATNITQFPGNGAMLAVGSAYLGGEVIYVGTAESATDANLAPGGYVYSGFAKYANGAYSEGRFASAGIDGSHALGSISFDLDTDTATVTQPGSAAVTISNIMHDDGAGTLFFDVTIESEIGSNVFAPKLVFGALPVGSLNGAGDPEATLGTMTSGSNFAGQRAVLYGPQALPSATPRTRTIEISGISGATSPYEFDIAFAWGRAAYLSPWCTYDGDGSVALADPEVDRDVRGFSDITGYDSPASDCRGLRGTVLSADGRFLYAGSRNGNRVGKWDTTTGQEVGGVTLATARFTGAASDIALDAGGTRIWVALNDGMHTGVSRSSAQSYLDSMDGRTETENSAVLVEVDVATMTETGRLELATGDIAMRGRRLALSRDGHQVALAIGHPFEANDEVSSNKVALVDAGSRTLVDASSATPGVDLLDLPDPIRSSQCAFSWSGDKLVCNNSWEADCDLLAVFDLGAAELTATSVDTDAGNTCSQKAMQFVPTADNNMWLIGDYNALTRLLADDTVEAIGNTSMYLNSAFIPDEAPQMLVAFEYGHMWVIDLTTGAQVSHREQDVSAYGHSMCVSPY